MEKIKTKIKDLLIIKKKTYKDNRGYFRELFRENILSKRFKFEILSSSKKMFYEDCIYKKKILRVNS